MNTSRRITDYWTKWKQLREMYGDMCFYCYEEAATTMDHVLPYSYEVINDLYNLRPACALCNSIVSNKIFKSVEEKRWYILDKLKQRHKLRHAFCTECGIAFIYRQHSPSLFLCPECYDLQYDTKQASRKGWKEWLELHDEAQWFSEIYREAGNKYRQNQCRGGHAYLVKCLLEAMRHVETKYGENVTIRITPS
jgi:hypothetical protein